MKYSILFLNYDPEEKLSDMTKENLYAIVKNSRGQDYELIVLDRKGIETDLNRGLQTARGDYIVIFCNDIVLFDKEWLNKLAIPDTITSWKASVSHWGFQEVDASLWCLPRSVIKRVGLFDTEYEGRYGYSDNDYLMRAHLLGIPFMEVPIRARHLERQTFNEYPLEDENDMSKNKAIFNKKFGLNV